MDYVIVIDGAGGEGCDYSIACNREYKEFSADTFEEVIEYVRENVEEYYSDDRISGYSVYEIKEDISKQVNAVFTAERRKIQKESSEKAEKEIEAKEKAELERLQNKYNRK